MKTLQIELPDEVAEGLAEYAEAQKQTPADLAARLVSDAILGLRDGC